MLTLTLRTQEIPPDHKGDYDLKLDTIEVAAETYDAAYADAQARVPDGWRVISVTVDRG